MAGRTHYVTPAHMADYQERITITSNYLLSRYAALHALVRLSASRSRARSKGGISGLVMAVHRSKIPASRAAFKAAGKESPQLSLSFPL